MCVWLVAWIFVVDYSDKLVWMLNRTGPQYIAVVNVAAADYDAINFHVVWLLLFFYSAAAALFLDVAVVRVAATAVADVVAITLAAVVVYSSVISAAVFIPTLLE